MAESLNKVMRREVVAGAGVMMAGAGNALAARCIEAAGFRTMLVSGAAVANSYLGVPDIGLVSVTELAEHVAAIRESVGIPILADADTGFGNAINTRRTVRLLERAGANAIMLEDQTFTERQKVTQQPGTCIHCHASVYVPYRKAGGGDLIRTAAFDDLQPGMASAGELVQPFHLVGL